MLEQPNIRRRDNGSIDIEFYRQAGLTERRLVMTDLAHDLKRVHRGFVAVLLLAAALYMAPSRDGTGWNEASPINVRHTGTMLESLLSSAQFPGTGPAGPASM